jgi:hypothetical protein
MFYEDMLQALREEPPGELWAVVPVNNRHIGTSEGNYLHHVYLDGRGQPCKVEVPDAYYGRSDPTHYEDRPLNASDMNRSDWCVVPVVRCEKPGEKKGNKYRKRPVIVEAMQFNPGGCVPDGMKLWPDENGAQPRDMTFGYIDTLEGRMHVSAGDWIIKGIRGEFYPCKPDIFDATYEKVEE